MSSVDYLREFVNERLCAAAEEIFLVFKNTIVEYEEEICRQRRLLDVVWKPEIKLHRIEVPQQHVFEEEEEEEEDVLADQQIWDQKRDSILDHEAPEPPQMKEEQQELCTREEGEQLVLKQETETFLLTPTYEESDHSQPEPKSDPPPEVPQQHVFEEEEEEEEVLAHQQIWDQERDSSLDHEAPEPPQIKEEQQELCTREEGERLVLKQETETFLLTPTFEESDHSQPEPKSDPQQLSDSFHVGESREQTGDHEDPGSTGDMEPESKKGPSKGNSPFIDAYVPPSMLEIHSNTAKGKKSIKKLLLCNTCGKPFNWISALRNHMRGHTGEKPFSCDTCGKRFTRASTVTMHMKIHTGEKPHLCTTCGKRFLQKSKLKRHMGLHTGKKPCLCLVCGKSFTQMRDLRRHARVHTGDRPMAYRRWETFQTPSQC